MIVILRAKSSKIQNVLTGRENRDDGSVAIQESRQLEPATIVTRVLPSLWTAEFGAGMSGRVAFPNE